MSLLYDQQGLNSTINLSQTDALWQSGLKARYAQSLSYERSYKKSAVTLDL